MDGAHTPRVGDVLGGLRLVERVGAGGMATVFRAEDEAGRSFAVKVMDASRVLPEDARRFSREYGVLSRIQHPNVVQVYRTGTEGSATFMVLQFVDGMDLGTAIQGWQADPPTDRFARAERVLRGLCEALSALHDLGVVHRDVKPSNVLIDGAGNPYLTDFGVVTSERGDAGTRLTQAGRLVGTVAFMAPELITGDVVDARTDLYALGALLYMMLTGRRPIEATSVAGFLARHLVELPSPPSDVELTVPPRLERLCMKLLAKSPDKRVQSARAVLAILDGDDGGLLPLRGREVWLDRVAAAAGIVRLGGQCTLILTGPHGSGRTAALEGAAAVAAECGLSIRIAHARRGPVGPYLVERAGDTTDPSQLGAWAARLGQEARALLVDDAEECEPIALQLLVEVQQRAARGEGAGCLVVMSVAGSPETIAARFAVSTALEAETFVLTPLDRVAVVAMVRDRGVTGPVAPVLARRLHREWDGNPGPIAEQIHALNEAGWLVQQREVWTAAVPLEQFKREALPPPTALVERNRPRLDALSGEERALVEVLALCGRPVSSGLVVAALGLGAALPVERLIRLEVVFRSLIEGVEFLELRDPPLVRSAVVLLSPENRKKRSLGIAKALAARRRADPVEVASHWEAADCAESAFPLLVNTARRGARGRSAAEVADLVERAIGLQALAEARMAPADFLPLRVWLRLLVGEAALARGQWGAARLALEAARDDARSVGDAAAIGRCQAALGRSLYRAGDFAGALGPLEEAVVLATGEDRGAAMRALADLVLRQGDVAGAEGRWREALREAPSPDAEARAHRGLADVLVLSGHLVEAAEQLRCAEDLLGPDGDPRVRASVLARATDLDLAAACWGAARARCDQLADVVRRFDLHDRTAEAWAMRASLDVALGEGESARHAVRNALALCRVPGTLVWQVHVRCGAVLADLGRFEEGGQLMLAPDAVAASPIDDPPARIAAVRARHEAHRNPARATDLARWALTRSIRLVLRALDVVVDASCALTALGFVEEAQAARDRALESTLLHPGLEGLRLRLLCDAWTVDRAPARLDAARFLVENAMDRAGGVDMGGFTETPFVRAVLARR